MSAESTDETTVPDDSDSIGCESTDPNSTSDQPAAMSMNETTVPDDGDSTDSESNTTPTSDQPIPMLVISMDETAMPEGGELTDPNPISNQPMAAISMTSTDEKTVPNGGESTDPKPISNQPIAAMSMTPKGGEPTNPRPTTHSKGHRDTKARSQSTIAKIINICSCFADVYETCCVDDPRSPGDESDDDEKRQRPSSDRDP